MTTIHRVATEVTYRSEGHDVSALLYEPTAQDIASPGIVLCPGRTRDIEGLAFLANALADNGFVVLATRYRGMELRGDDADADAALDHLSELDTVDNNRLGIVGHSRGGVCALRMAAKDTRIRTAAALQPPVDLARIVRATEHLSADRYQALVNQLGGTPDANPQTYAALSTLSYATQIKIPVLILAGTMDLYSPADHCRDMYQAIKAAGNERAKLVTLEVGHFFERTYHGYEFENVAAVVVDWLQEQLE
jgi:dipeptidyl aminopeptidase/acylaminoacyl peptidase